MYKTSVEITYDLLHQIALLGLVVGHHEERKHFSLCHEVDGLKFFARADMFWRGGDLGYEFHSVIEVYRVGERDKESSQGKLDIFPIKKGQYDPPEGIDKWTALKAVHLILQDAVREFDERVGLYKSHLQERLDLLIQVSASHS